MGGIQPCLNLLGFQTHLVMVGGSLSNTDIPKDNSVSLMGGKVAIWKLH